MCVRNRKAEGSKWVAKRNSLISEKMVNDAEQVRLFPRS